MLGMNSKRTLVSGKFAKEIKEKALTKGISERSTCRYLKSLLELKYIDKQEDRYIRIKEFTDK